MALSNAFVDELQERLPLPPIVGQFIPLRRWHTEWRGPCPITPDKKQAFIVTDQRGIYHCFACGMHGDIFAFFRECADGPDDQRIVPDSIEAWDRQDALQFSRFKKLVPFLANAAGLEVPADYMANTNDEKPVDCLITPRIGSGWVTRPAHTRGHHLLPNDMPVLLELLAAKSQPDSTLRLVHHDPARQRLIELLCRPTVSIPDLYTPNKFEHLAVSLTGYDWVPHAPTGDAYAELKLNFVRNTRKIEIRHAHGPLAELASLGRVIGRRLREIDAGKTMRRLRISPRHALRDVTHRRVAKQRYALGGII